MKMQAGTTQRRKHERVQVALPVRLDDANGTTCNISVGGMYLEFDDKAQIGSEISFEVEMATPLGPMKLTCSGTVVRKDQIGQRTGLAVHVTDSQLQATEDSSGADATATPAQTISRPN